MEIKIQKCNKCQKLNDTDKQDWPSVVKTLTKPMPRQVKLDFCPSCASVVTVSQLDDFAPALPVRQTRPPVAQASPANEAQQAS